MPSSYQDLNSKTEKFNSDREARYKKPKISAPPQQFDTRSVMTRALLLLYMQGALGFDSERHAVNAASRGRRPAEINDTSQAADLRRRLAEVDHLDRVARVRRIDGMMNAAMARSQSGSGVVVPPDNEVPASTSDVPAQEPHSIPATEEHNTITQTDLRPGERDVAIPLERGFMNQLFHELQTGQRRDAAPIPASQGSSWFGAEALPIPTLGFVANPIPITSQKPASFVPKSNPAPGRKNTYSPVYSYSMFGPSSTLPNVRATDAINKLLNYRLYEEMGIELKNKVTEVVTALKVGKKVSYAQLLLDMQRVIYTLISEHGKDTEKMFDLMLAQKEIQVQMFNLGGIDLVNMNDDILETPEDDVNPEYIERRFNPDKNIPNPDNELNQRQGYLSPPAATESGNDYEGVISAGDAAKQIHADVPFKDILATATATINKNRLSRQKHPSEASVRHWKEVEDLYYKNAHKIDITASQDALEKREYFLLYRTLLHYSLLEQSLDSTSTEYAEIQADKQYALDIAEINKASYRYLLNLNYHKLKTVAEACDSKEQKLWPLYTSELAREAAGENIQDLYLVNTLISKLISANRFAPDTALLIRPIDALKEYAQINPIAIVPEKQTTPESPDDEKSYRGFRNSNEFTEQSHYTHQFAHYINANSRDEAKNITSTMELNQPVNTTIVGAHTYGFAVHHQTGWLAQPNTDNADVLPGRIGAVQFSDGSLYVTAFIEGELREKLYSYPEMSANPVLSSMTHIEDYKHLSQANNRGTRRGFSWQTDSTLRGESLYKYLLDSLWGSFIESPVSDYNFPFAELVFNHEEHHIDVQDKNLTEIVSEVIHLALVDTAHVLKGRLRIKSDAQKIAEDLVPLYQTLYDEFTDEMHEMNWEEFLVELALLALQFAPIGIKFAKLPVRATLQIREVVTAYRAQGLRGAALAKASAPSVMNIAVEGALQAGKLLARGASEAVDPYPIDFMQQLSKTPRSVLNSRTTQNFGFPPLIQSALNKARKMNSIQDSAVKRQPDPGANIGETVDKSAHPQFVPNSMKNSVDNNLSRKTFNLDIAPPGLSNSATRRLLPKKPGYYRDYPVIAEGTAAKIYDTQDGYLIKEYKRELKDAPFSGDNPSKTIKKSSSFSGALAEARNNRDALNRLYGEGSASLDIIPGNTPLVKIVYVKMKKIPGLSLSSLLKNADDTEISMVENILNTPDKFTSQVNIMLDKLRVNGIQHYDINLGNIIFDPELQQFHFIDFDRASINPVIDGKISPLSESQINTMRSKLISDFNEFLRSAKKTDRVKKKPVSMAAKLFGKDASFDEIARNTGIYYLRAHGSFGNTGHFSGVQTANKIRTLLDKKPIIRLELKSCYGGFGGKYSNAQIIANELNIPVKAYTKKVSNYSKQKHPNDFVLREPMGNDAEKANMIAKNEIMFGVSERLLRIRRTFYAFIRRSGRDDVNTQLENIAKKQDQTLSDDMWLTACFEEIMTMPDLLAQLELTELKS